MSNKIATTASSTFDIAIVGGGLVGTTLALLLAKLPLRVAIIEQKDFFESPANGPKNTPQDIRALALSKSSQLFLAQMGVWDKIAAIATPIIDVHISDRGHFGKVRLSAKEARVPALGYVVPAENLIQLLRAQVAEGANLTVIARASVAQVTQTAFGIAFKLNDANHPTAGGRDSVQKQISALPEHHARLLVLADGGRSTLREQCHIPIQRFHTDQTAIVTTVKVFHPTGIAYERFTETGPIALLPLPNSYYELVATVHNKFAPQQLELSDADFMMHWQKRFGTWLGPWQTLGKRLAYPLQYAIAKQTTAANMVLVGNAAQTIHPIAAQGFNLGLRDVVTLSAHIQQAIVNNQDFAHPNVLTNYAKARKPDQSLIIWSTRQLLNVFNISAEPFTWLRNAGLVAVACCPWVKNQITRFGMGLEANTH